MSILSYDVYCNPTFPANHPDFGKSGGTWNEDMTKNEVYVFINVVFLKHGADEDYEIVSKDWAGD